MDPSGDEAMLMMHRRRRIQSADYWRALVPTCRITDYPFSNSVTLDVSPGEASRLRGRICREGYFQTKPIVPEAWRDRLIDCIERVVAAGHAPSYALLFDEFYALFGSLGAVLNPILGEGFQLVPDELAAYHVPASDEAAGAHPHRDALRTPTSVSADGCPTLVNVWIALRDVEPPQSCIYVVPAHLDPHYPRDGVAPEQPSEITISGTDLQSIRALPARAGSVLVWSTHLIHWGSRSSALATSPRVSVASYFQSRTAPPAHRVTMDIPSPLPFDYRLYLVEKVFRDPEGKAPYV